MKKLTILFTVILTLSITAVAQSEKLFDAARNNDVKTLEELVKTGANVNARDAKGYSPLILASYNGSQEAVEFLLKKKADVHQKDNLGRTALMSVSFRGYLPIVKLLVENEAKPNEKDIAGATALMFAAMVGRVSVVKYLLEIGADAKIIDERGNTALRLAEQQGADEVIAILKVIADPDLVSQLEGDIGTPEIGYVAAKKILARGKSFTAPFAFNDISAIGAIRALQEAGLRVPEDVSVLGFDDIYAAEFHNPALTTIRQPLFEMGMRLKLF